MMLAQGDLKQWITALQDMQGLINGAETLEGNVRFLGQWLSLYPPICKMALVRLHDDARPEQYAAWSRDGDFSHALFERYLTRYLPAFKRVLAQQGTLTPQTWAHMQEEFMGQDALGYNPIVRPLLRADTCIGLAFFGKERTAGAWRAEEKSALNLLLATVNLPAQEPDGALQDYALQGWVFDQFTDNMRAHLYVTDMETDRILFMNETMKKAYGLAHPEGQVCWQVLQKGMNGRCPFCPVVALQQSKDPHPSCVWEEVNAITGCTYENYDSVMRWTDGRLVHFQQSIEITDAKAITQSANIDELTGMLNRRGGKEALLSTLERACRQDVSVSVVLYDVNLLKQVNDTFGHLEGDSLLKLVAQVVGGKMQKGDYPFRLSGDEFVVVFFNCDSARANHRMRGIQSALAQEAKRQKKPYEVSFCYGVMEVKPQDTMDLSEIISRADEQMYVHKRRFHRSRIARQPQSGAPTAHFRYDKEHLYEALIRSTDDYIYICNMQTNTFRFPPSMVRDFDLPGEVLFNATPIWGSLIHPQDRPTFYRSMQEIENGATSTHDEEYRVRNRRGEWVSVHCRGYVSRDESGQPLLFAGVITPMEQETGGAGARMNAQKQRLYELALKSTYTEVYQYNLQTEELHLLMRTDARLKRIAYTGDMRLDKGRMLRTAIHPEDKDIYLELYDNKRIEACFAQGDAEITGRYRRQDLDGHYRWISASIVPLAWQDNCCTSAMIMLKDISQRKELEERQAALEHRFEYIFRNSWDAILEIRLDTGMYNRTLFKHQQLYQLPERGLYAAAVEEMLLRVHPQDAARVRNAFSLEQLRHAARNHLPEVICTYRLRQQDGSYKWTEDHIFTLPDDPPTGIVAMRDVTAQKLMEHQQHIGMQYDAALRNIYDELYELNITQDTYRIVYHTEGKYVTPPEQGVLHEAIADVADHMIFSEDRARFLSFFDIESIRKAFAAGRESVIGEFRKLWQDGAYHWASLTVFPVAQNGQDDEVLLCFIMDIGDKKRADEMEEQNRRLRQQQLDDERYRIVVESTGACVFEWSAQMSRHSVPDSIAQQFAGNYDGRPLFAVLDEDHVVHVEDRDKLRDLRRRIAQQGDQSAETVVRLRRRNGGYVWCRLVVTCMRDAQGRLVRAIGTLTVVDAMIKSQQALRYRAEYDTLTGVFNRQTFFARAQEEMQTHPEAHYAIMRMDIRRFRFINDLYGTEEGDKLLRHIAGLFGSVLSQGDIIGRINSDVFCLCVRYETQARLQQITERITRVLADYKLDYRIVPYFGICLVEDRAAPVSTLSDWAQLALDTVKGDTLRNVAYYDDALRARQLDERKIENEMEGALASGQFRPYFQPKYDISTGRVIGAEALVRWVHPTEGVMPPARFVPLFESNGFIIRLDTYMWEETFKCMRAWRQEGLVPMPISMNVSRKHIFNAGLCQTLLDLTQRYEIPHDLVELELTESTFIENPRELYEKMETLQKVGFLFSMDDFGSGYSSLNMLKDVRVNTIKLDRGFLNETVSTPRGQTVIKCTIGMANQLHLRVLSEGVESKQQAEFLLQAGCSMAQGYYFAAPMPEADFVALLRRQQRG
nr:EAL domain-containing protein [Maliibacterium massiliense]